MKFHEAVEQAKFTGRKIIIAAWKHVANDIHLFFHPEHKCLYMKHDDHIAPLSSFLHDMYRANGHESWELV